MTQHADLMRRRRAGGPIKDQRIAEGTALCLPAKGTAGGGRLVNRGVDRAT